MKRGNFNQEPQPKLFVLILLLLCPMFHAFGQWDDYEKIVAKKYADRQFLLYKQFYANSQLRSDSTKFFEEVNKLKKIAEKENDEELQLEAEFIRFNYLSSRGYENYLPEIKKFLEKVDKLEILQLQARIRQAIGLHYYYERENLGQAYLYMTSSYDYLNQLTDKELPDKQELLYNIAYVNYHVGYETKALKYLKEAEVLEIKYYQSLLCNIINTKGMIYEKNGDLELALENYYSVLDLAKKLGSEEWIQIASKNIAKSLIKKNNYEEALALLEKNYLENIPVISNHKKNEYTEILVERSILLAKIYHHLGKDILFQKEIKFLSSVKNLDFLSASNKKEIFMILALDQKEKGNFEQAYIFSDSSIFFYNKILEQAYDLNLKQAIERENIEGLLEVQAKAENQKKITRITQISMSVIFILTIIIFIGIYLRQKEKYKSKRKEVEKELSKSKSKLMNLVGDLKLKNKEVEAYEEELNVLLQSQNKDENEVQERKNTIEQLISKPLLTDTKWIVFKRTFDKVYPDYHQSLTQKIPKISQAEIRYMYLRKLQLSPKDITHILGVSQGSIRQYKYRIKSKLPNLNDEDFDKFLHDI